MKIFIVNGVSGIGKDTFKQYVGEVYNGAVSGTSMVAFVKILAEKAGWQGTKKTKDRKFLHNLKTLLDEYNDMPFISTCITIEQMNTDGINCCFVDARDPKDIQKLKEKFKEDCKTILIMSSIATSNLPGDEKVNDYNYDIIIDNSGSLDDLRLKAEEFVKNFLEV